MGVDVMVDTVFAVSEYRGSRPFIALTTLRDAVRTAESMHGSEEGFNSLDYITELPVFGGFEKVDDDG